MCAHFLSVRLGVCRICSDYSLNADEFVQIYYVTIILFFNLSTIQNLEVPVKKSEFQKSLLMIFNQIYHFNYCKHLRSSAVDKV